jgi:hypothetical protein
VYRTRISPKWGSLTIAKVRYQPHKTWVTSWVTHDAPIELPRKIGLGYRKIRGKAAAGPHTVALLGPEFDFARYFQHRAISPSCPSNGSC